MSKNIGIACLIIFTACENGDYKKGKEYMSSGEWDSAIESFKKVPEDDKMYNESMTLINESISVVIKENTQKRKSMLSNNYNWSTKEISDWQSFSNPLLTNEFTNIITKKKENGEWFYSKYPMLFFDDVMVWTTYYSDGYPQKNVRDGAKTTLIFKQNGEGEIVMKQGASEKRANLDWTIFWSLGNNSNKDNYINFKITGVEIGTPGFQTYPSNFSDNFKNNRGKVKVNRLINDSKIIQKDRQGFYNFSKKIKADFINKITPLSFSE